MFGRFRRFLRALGDAVLGNQLLRMLLCVGNDAFGFAFCIVDNAVAMAARVLQSAIGLRTSIGHQPISLAARVANHALRFVLRTGDDLGALLRDLGGFLQIFRQGFAQLCGLHKKTFLVY